MNDKKGKNRCSDSERILKCDYFIAGNSTAVVPLAAQAHVIFNHKIAGAPNEDNSSKPLNIALLNVF